MESGRPTLRASHCLPAETNNILLLIKKILLVVVSGLGRGHLGDELRKPLLARFHQICFHVPVIGSPRQGSLHAAAPSSLSSCLGVDDAPLSSLLERSHSSGGTFVSLVTRGAWQCRRHVVNMMSKGCQNVVKRLSTCCQKVVKMLSKGCQKAVKMLSKGYQNVVKRLSKCCHPSRVPWVHALLLTWHPARPHGFWLALLLARRPGQTHERSP